MILWYYLSLQRSSHVVHNGFQTKLLIKQSFFRIVMTCRQINFESGGMIVVYFKIS